MAYRSGLNTILPTGCGLLAALLGMSVIACKRDQDKEPVGEQPTVEQVTEEPNRFIGERVRLSGEVDNVYSAQAFELESDDPIFDNEILVLTKSPVMLAGETLDNGDDVVVTGTIRMLTVAVIERDLGWDLVSTLEARWQNKPIVVADRISVVEEFARWSEADEREGTRVGVTSLHMAVDPQTLAGQRIILEGIPVQSKAGNGMWIGENRRARLFVAPAGDTRVPDVAVDDRVDLRGTVRVMPPMDQVKTQWNADPALSAELAQEPLYIEAERVSKAEPRATERR